MSGGYVPVDSITDQTGDSITVSVLDDLVCLRINENDETPMVWLNAAQRDQFVKAFVAATYRAEAPAGAHAGRRDGHGEADGR